MGGLNPPVFSGGPVVIGQPPLAQVGTEDLPIKRAIHPKMNIC